MVRVVKCYQEGVWFCDKQKTATLNVSAAIQAEQTCSNSGKPPGSREMLSGVLDKWGYFLIPQILSVLLLMSGIFGFGFFLLSFVTRSLESTFYCFLRSVPSPVYSSSAPCLAILFPSRFAKRTFPLYRRVTANFYCIFSDENGTSLYRNRNISRAPYSVLICNTSLSAVVIMGFL